MSSLKPSYFMAICSNRVYTQQNKVHLSYLGKTEVEHLMFKKIASYFSVITNISKGYKSFFIRIKTSGEPKQQKYRP